MIDKDLITNALYDIFLQARNGRIEIDTTDHIPYTYNVHFLVSSLDIRINTTEENDDQTPTLHLDNIDRFVDALLPKVEYYYDLYKEDYPDLDEEHLVEMICASYFFNMTYFDFVNPVAYIHNLPKSKPVESCFDLNIDGKDYTVAAVHRINALNLETIDCMKVVLKDEQNIHVLPSINYQIIGNRAVIKSIQGNKDSKGSEYITPAGLPHVAGMSNKHLRNINPATLLSLTIAIKTLKEQAGVKEFDFPLYMPIRYNALIETLSRKEEMAQKRAGNTDIDKEQIIEQSIDKADTTQFNITNKLSNTVLRFLYHFDNFDITDYGDDSFTMTIKEYGESALKDDILHRIFNARTKTITR